MSFLQDDDELVNETPEPSTELFSSDSTAPAAGAPAEPEVVAVGDTDDDEVAPADWAEGPEAAPEAMKEGQIVTGTVLSITDSGVIVDIGAKSDGFIPLSEFASASDRPAVDDKVEVAVVRIDDEHDQIRLSKRRADYERVWNELEELAKTHGIVQAMVTERVKGGLRVDLGVPGFVPASHVGTKNLRNLERFVGRSLNLKVLEADRASKKVVLSHRELVEAEREKRKDETLAKLEEGMICEGKVRNLTNYGAFIDLGGVDGLLHVSEMSWTRVAHPSDVMKVGDTVRVVVLEVGSEGDRISLGMRQILPDPWKEAAAKLKPNSVVKARITRVVPTGAFALLLEADIEGFIPIRELSEKRISEAGDVVKRDQDVDLKILEIRKEARRMTLSLVAAEQERQRAEYREFMGSQDTARPTLGDQFGALLAAVVTTDAAEAVSEGAQAVADVEAVEAEAAAEEAAAALEAAAEAQAAADAAAAEAVAAVAVAAAEEAQAAADADAAQAIAEAAEVAEAVAEVEAVQAEAAAEGAAAALEAAVEAQATADAAAAEAVAAVEFAVVEEAQAEVAQEASAEAAAQAAVAAEAEAEVEAEIEPSDEA
jgi:ribosomal protein S1